VILAVGIATFLSGVAGIDRYLVNRLPYDEPAELFVVFQRPGVRPPEWTAGGVPAQRFMELSSVVAPWTSLAMCRHGGSLRIKNGRDTVLLQSIRVTPSFIDVLNVRGMMSERPGAFAGPSLLLSSRAARLLGIEAAGATSTSVTDLASQTSFEIAAVLPMDFVAPMKGGPDVDALVLDPSMVNEPYSSADVLIGRNSNLATHNHVKALLQATLPSSFGANLEIDDLHGFVVGDMTVVIAGTFAAAAAVLVVCIASFCILFAIRRTLRSDEWMTRRYLGATDADLRRGQLYGIAMIVFVSTVIALWSCVLLAISIERLTATSVWSLAERNIILRLVLVSAVVAAAIVMCITTVMKLVHQKDHLSVRKRSTARIVGIAAQLSLSTMLIVTAGSIAQSVVNLFGQDTGFDPRSLVVSVSYPVHGESSSLDSTMQQTIEAIGRLPGVQFVGAAIGATLDRLVVMGQVEIHGDRMSVVTKQISGAYFLASGGGFVLGHPPRTGDEVVVNEAFARAAGSFDLIGTQLRVDRVLTIVGIAKDERGFALDAAPRPTILRPARRIWHDCSGDGCGQISYVIKTSDTAVDLSAAISRTIQRLSDGSALISIGEIGERLRSSVAKRAFASSAMLLFAIATACASLIGITSVVSFTIVHRWTELAIRAALGATATRLVQVVVSEVLAGVAFGMAIGTILGRMLVNYIGHLLYGVIPADWTPQIAALGCFVVAAVIAASLSMAPAIGMRVSMALRNN